MSTHGTDLVSGSLRAAFHGEELSHFPRPASLLLRWRFVPTQHACLASKHVILREGHIVQHGRKRSIDAEALTPFMQHTHCPLPLKGDTPKRANVVLPTH